MKKPTLASLEAYGRLVKHARYYWLLLAESHLTRRLFGSMVRRIAVLSLPTGEWIVVQSAAESDR